MGSDLKWIVHIMTEWNYFNLNDLDIYNLY